MNYRVLLVEDNVAILNMTNRILSDQGYDVTTCSSAGKARELLHEDRSFDIVISDNDTGPGITGSDLYLVALGYGLPFILVTGEPPENFTGVLMRKPLAIQALLATIHQEINRFRTLKPN